MSEPPVPFKVKAIFEYKSDYEDDLSFSVGQIITITAIENDEWYSGEYEGNSGMFPKNFVEILATPQIPISNRPAKKHATTSSTEESKLPTSEVESKPESIPDSKPENNSTTPSTSAAPAPAAAAPITGAKSNETEDYTKHESGKSPISPVIDDSKQHKVDEHHIPKVPMPQSNIHKPADPYSIKKQFVAASTSSYVPKIKPRDESNLIAHTHKEAKPAEDIVRSSEPKREQEEVEEPKVSLKERIALLQKKQQEEAEREAAALKRKEERLHKQAEEKERIKHLRAQASGESQIVDNPDGTNLDDGVEEQNHINEHNPLPDHSRELGDNHHEQVGAGADAHLGIDDGEAQSQSVRTKAKEPHGHKSIDPRLGRNEDEEAEESKIEATGEEEEDDDDEYKENDQEDQGDEEDEEDEEDEDLKRRKLVERMAKISGGRNMFGMMGMASPFGAGAAPPNNSKPTKAKVETKKHLSDSKTLDSQSVSTPNVSSNATAKAPLDAPHSNPPPVGAPSVSHASAAAAAAAAPAGSASGGNIATDVSTNPGTLSPKFNQESSSMAEDDEPSDSDSAEPVVRKELLKQNPRQPPSLSSALDSGAEDKVNDQPIKLQKHGAIETETTGYEADEDLSDMSKPHANGKPFGESYLDEAIYRDKDSNETIALANERIAHPDEPAPPIEPRPTRSDAPPISPVPPLPQHHSGSNASGYSAGATHSTPHSHPPPPAPPSNPAAPSFVQAEQPDQLHDNSASSVPSVPPIPSVPPVPPIPSRRYDNVSEPLSQSSATSNNFRGDVLSNSSTAKREEEEGDDYSEDEENDAFEVVDVPPPVPSHTPRASTFASSDQSPHVRGPPPPIPGSGGAHPPPPPIPVGAPPKRATTDIPPLMQTSTGASVGSTASRKSVDLDPQRSRSLKKTEQSQAEAALEQFDYEVSNIKSNSNWWLNGELPDSLASRIGVDLYYEVDANKIHKRGGRIINYRDYYVLFYDLSQLVFELEFEEQDPRGSIHLVNQFVKPSPPIRKDLLDSAHRNFGSIIAKEATQLAGHRIDERLTSHVFQGSGIAKDIIPPIGNKAFGVTIYKNHNNSSVSKIDDIQAGDILWIKNGKFDAHKGIMGNKSVSLGESYTAIIYEFDPAKDKFKVLEQDSSGLVKKESYKLGNLKSGRIRVFRPIPKSYVGM
ncbi:hypothetical protein PVL30_000802 [Lodderomyces elongisporus]|uniref:uncharacterized protein n=1 Tax=Lodderomyces elongisporus TaxID=36914 RepID=UPI0029273D9D|nr:uncharacterized protein PVL30_000802 [Lodderomyces elongisporus]WLF77093.1 hypothetical protein PVL30_000802 [Lodderomyces elongisporus]